MTPKYMETALKILEEFDDADIFDPDLTRANMAVDKSDRTAKALDFQWALLKGTHSKSHNVTFTFAPCEVETCAFAFEAGVLADYPMPLPDSLICKNGSDEYLRTGTDAEFYRGGYFPFDYKRPNLEKEKAIKKLTGWDSKKIREKLTELFKAHDLQIVTAGTENKTKDYGWKSLFASYNLDGCNPY